MLEPPLAPPASAPCSLHELDAAGKPYSDSVQARDVARWRKVERERLIDARLARPAPERDSVARAIGRDLAALVDALGGGTVSVYWPIRGEPDLRPWMHRLHERGLQVALPLIVAPAKPLAFRVWHPGCRLERGVFNIPYPADGPSVTPTVTIAPLVGFDAQYFRLGYGGGYFDRTLAALEPRPCVIGVGYDAGELATIFPQPYDIPMEWIVTGTSPPRQRTEPTVAPASSGPCAEGVPRFRAGSGSDAKPG